MHAIDVTVSGGNVLLVIDAATKIPLAVTVAPIQEHEALWTRALVTQGRAHLGEYARLHTVIFAKGFLAGTEPWWLQLHGIVLVVPANAHMAVTEAAQAQAAAGEGSTVGRWMHTVRHEQMRELVIVLAQGAYGISHLAAYSLIGVKLKEVRLGIGPRQDILAKYRLISHV
ncbi:MAG TPA: hypothetical protein VGC99_27630 [Candidatus Tectomicrobia bacterium]